MAEAAYRHVLAVEPTNSDANYLLGLVLHQTGRHEAALGHMLAAASAKPADAELLNNLGSVHRALGRSEDALECYRRAIVQAPDSATVRDNLANLLSDLGRYEEAIEHYREVLSKNRAHAAAAYHLGVALALLHRPTEAVAALQQAIDVAPNHAEAQFSLANAYAETGDLDKAIEHYSRALRLAPDRANAYINLGNALFEKGRLSTAVQNFRRAVELAPKDPDAQVNLGNALESLGQIADAENAFRAAIRNAARLGAAHQALARVKKFKAGDPDLQVLERLHGDSKLRGDDRTSVCFALGKAYDDVGDIDKAFAALTEANRRVRDRLDYDVEEHRRLYAGIERTFDAALFERLRGSGDASGRPIFVLGMPRSGTTLIEQILAAHPRVHGAGELTVLPRLVERIAGDGKIPFPEFVAAADRTAFADWGARYVAEVRASTPDSPHTIDKLPANHRLIGLIHLILPNATIVHCRRHPLAVCFSCYQQQFTGRQRFAYDLAELGEVYRLYDRLMAHWRRVLPGRMVEVRYEDVVADQQGATRRLLDQIGLDWHAATLSFDKVERPVMTASAAQVRRPIYDEARERWRRYEKHLGPLIEALGPAAAYDTAD